MPEGRGRLRGARIWAWRGLQVSLPPAAARHTHNSPGPRNPRVPLQVARSRDDARIAAQ